MWILVTLFVASVGSPVQLNQMGPAENDLSSCEALKKLEPFGTCLQHVEKEEPPHRFTSVRYALDNELALPLEGPFFSPKLLAKNTKLTTSRATT